MRCWSTVPMVCCNVERSFLLLVILFLSFQAMLNDRSHRLMRCWTTVPIVWSNVERSFHCLMWCWMTVPMVWCNVERSYFSFVILVLSFNAMLNNRPHRLMRCWTTVPMVWCNVERPFFVIWYCSYGLMQCWTTVLVVCHIVPFVWSNVERSFSLSNAMLNDCSYGLILCWTTVLVICYVVPIVWCNYKCFQKKTLTHRLYYYHRPPPLCRVNLYQTQIMQSRAKKNWHYLLAEGGVLCHNFCRWWPTSWTTGILIRILRRPTRLVRWNSAYLWK